VIRTHSASEFELAKKAFWTTEIAEKIVRFVVSMERRDTSESVKASRIKFCALSLMFSARQSYTMFVGRYEVQPETCLPRVEAGYSCDIAKPDCQFCKKRRAKLGV
jgi:hypothetical protein